MEYLLGGILTLLFLYYNYKVVRIDSLEKRIPNLYLMYLLGVLPIWYIYAGYYGYFSEVQVWIFLLQMFLTLLISFILYYFSMWGAGDAKYLLVLGLFIPYIGIVGFISSIATITLVMLLGHFLWFWGGPNLWIQERRKTLYARLWETKKDQLIDKNRDISKKALLIKGLVWCNTFIIIFISIRILRIDLFYFLQEYYNREFTGMSLIEFIGTYKIYISIILVFIIGTGVGIKMYVYPYLKQYFSQRSTLYFLVPLNIFGGLLLMYEYIKNPLTLGDTLVFILTICLGIYLTVKILLFGYKLVFVYEEETFIHIQDLKHGMIVDKQFLNNLVNMQWDIYDKSEDKTIFENMEPKAFFQPIDSRPYIESLGSPVSDKEVKELQLIFQKVNTLHTDYKTPNYSYFDKIKIVKNHAFAPYIFSGFVLTFFVDAYLGTSSISLILKFIQQFYS